MGLWQKDHNFLSSQKNNIHIYYNTYLYAKVNYIHKNTFCQNSYIHIYN